MEEVKMYKCSYCKEIISEDELECREHEKHCDKFIGKIQGVIHKDNETGYRIDRIGDMNICDLVDRLDGQEVIVEVVNNKQIKNKVFSMAERKKNAQIDDILDAL